MAARHESHPYGGQKMNSNTTFLKIAVAVASATFAGWLLAACSQTAAPEPNVIQRAQGENPAPPRSGFLGSNYSLLQPAAPGTGQEAMLAYFNPNGTFS